MCLKRHCSLSCLTMYSLFKTVDASVQWNPQRKRLQSEQDCPAEFIASECNYEEKEVLWKLGWNGTIQYVSPLQIHFPSQVFVRLQKQRT